MLGGAAASARLDQVPDLEDRVIADEVRAFFLSLGERAFRPVLEAAAADRWECLQGVLLGPFDEVLQGAPMRPAASQGHGRGVEVYAQSLARAFDGDMAEILEQGARSRRRRNQLLARRGDALSGEYARMSHTAASAFVWALLLIGMSGFYQQESNLVLGDDCWDFVVSVLHRGGLDQYRLLRVAENRILDDEEERSLVEEGELSVEASAMESVAHRAWLEVQHEDPPSS